MRFTQHVYQQQEQQRAYTRTHTHTRTLRSLLTQNPRWASCAAPRTFARSEPPPSRHPPSPRRPRAHRSETTVPSAGVSASSTVPSVMMTLSKRNHPR